MLRSDTLFGKKDATPPVSPVGSPSSLGSSGSGFAKPVYPGNAPSSTNPATHTAPAGTSSSTSSSTNEVGSKLIVGPNIKLKGVEITDCDTLVVEGRVEATMDSRVIQIAEMGAFKGSAEIDLAEIRGEFDGELTVREKLVIYATGKVSGKIRYGRLVIEEGGQITGDVQVNGTSAKAAVVAAPTAVTSTKAVS
ncbi:MAG: polymer-forming cytoskeletal protein [Herbaspirillum sp.]